MADARGPSSIGDPYRHLLPTGNLSPICDSNPANQEADEETAPSVSSNLSEWDQDLEDYSDDSGEADGAYHHAFSNNQSGLSRLLVSTEQPIYTYPLLSSDTREANELADEYDDYDYNDDQEELEQEGNMISDLDTEEYRSQDSPRQFPLPNQLIEPNQVRALTEAYSTQIDVRSDEEAISEHRLLELQARRLASEHRRKMLARVPVGGRNGKQWKASDLPLRIIRQIVHLVAMSIVTEEVQIKLADGDNRMHFGKQPVGLTIAHIRARSRIAPLRLICKSWKQAVETIPFWSELSTAFGFPQTIRPYYDNDCLITRLCWVCHFARFPLSQPAAYVRTALGTIWICKLHLTVPFCGRCLRSRVDPAFRSRRLQWTGPRTSLPEYTAPNEDIDPGLRLTEDDDMDDDDEDINGGDELYGPNMASCQRCRFECLQEAVSNRDPNVRIDLEDSGDLECFFQYVERAQGSADSTAVNLLERRWLARWTKFHDLATQVVQTNKINPIKAAPADGNDMRAIFKASMGIEGDGSEPMAEELEKELAQFEYETAAIRGENVVTTDRVRDDVSDGEGKTHQEGVEQEEDEEREEVEDEDEDGGVELTPGGYIQIVEMATEAWIHQRVIEGFWVSPLEQRAFQETFSRQSPSMEEAEIAFNVVHPLDSPLLEYSIYSASSHLNGPLPPAGGALDQKAFNLYSRKLRSILLPGLNQISRLCALQKDPLTLAPKLSVQKLLELLRLPGAWVHGGLDNVELVFDQADGLEQASIIPTPIPMLPPSIHDPGNITPSDNLRSMITSSTAMTNMAESPLSTDSISLSAISSHTASPVRTGSSPPTSLSPPPCAAARGSISSAPSVLPPAYISPPYPQSNPASNINTNNLRFPLSPRTSRPIPQVPRIPLDASELGLSTKDIIKRAWWDACDDLRKCMCSICLRGLRTGQEERQDEEVMSNRKTGVDDGTMEEEEEETTKRKGGDEDLKAGDKKQRIEIES